MMLMTMMTSHRPQLQHRFGLTWRAPRRSRPASTARPCGLRGRHPHLHLHLHLGLHLQLHCVPRQKAQRLPRPLLLRLQHSCRALLHRCWLRWQERGAIAPRARPEAAVPRAAEQLSPKRAERHVLCSHACYLRQPRPLAHLQVQGLLCPLLQPADPRQLAGRRRL